MSELVTAVVMKCKKDDEKPGRSWCVYKPKSDGGIMSPQPKGFPKTFKTQKEAEYGVKMMKTFGEVGWFTEVVLPAVYIRYIKNPNIFKNKETFLASIEDDKEVRSFFEQYEDKIDLTKHWAEKFHAIKTKAEGLRIIGKKIENSFKKESRVITSIYRRINVQATEKIITKYLMKQEGMAYDNGNPSTEYPGPSGYSCPPKCGRKRSGRPNPPSGYRRQTVHLCPHCHLTLLRDYDQKKHSCRFCGKNPMKKLSLQPKKDKEGETVEIVRQKGLK